MPEVFQILPSVVRFLSHNVFMRSPHSVHICTHVIFDWQSDLLQIIIRLCKWQEWICGTTFDDRPDDYF